MSNTTLFVATVVGMAVGVVAIFGALRLFTIAGEPMTENRVVLELRRLERIKLLLIGVLGVIVVALTFIVNDVSNHINQLEDVRDNQDCIIALIRTPSPYLVTDDQLRAAGCPAMQPFTP